MKRPMHLSELGEICVHISSFLDLPQLSRCEVAAHFFPSKESLSFAWDEAAERIRHQVPVWGPSGHSVIHQLLEEGIRGKAFLRELRLLRRAIFPPKAWVPEVVEKSFCSAVVMPHDEQSSSGFEDIKTPTEVAVPLTIGCYVGQALAVGMQVKIDASAAEVDSSFCIGVEICAPSDVGTSMSVLFAPFSGLCFMQYRGEACVLSTPALPALTGTGEVFSWANVCEDGSMYFLRESIDGEEKKVEATGILPRDAFPKWASEYFVCAHVWRSYLPSPLEMLMHYSQQTLPEHLRSYIPEKHVDSTWHLLQS